MNVMPGILVAPEAQVALAGSPAARGCWSQATSTQLCVDLVSYVEQLTQKPFDALSVPQLVDAYEAYISNVLLDNLDAA